LKKICAIIPARYNSKRLPGKPLLKIKDKEILYLTYLKVRKIFSPEDIYIFTESKKLKNIMKNKISNIFVVKGKFKNGTERSSAGLKFIKKKYYGSIIVSCDNPYLSLDSIYSTMNIFKKFYKDKSVACTTVHTKSSSLKKFKNRSVAKVVLNKFNDIIYLSRSPIPSLTKKYFYTHHGPVCLKNDILKKYIKFKFSSLQKNEDNEWLNLIFNGYKIKSKLVKNISREINTKEDLRYYRNLRK
jgi:3-deoxy-manno-octulosonate cytidylyltransferase (CMP-KDO synthetase)